MSLNWTRGFASVSSAGPCVDSLPTRPHVHLSYVHGASASPLTTTSVGGSLERSALTSPHRTAIISCQQGVALTFSELLTRVDRLACGFMSLGLERGDRIGVWGPNSVEWVITFLAASRAGLILVNVNPAYQAEELEYALKKVGCKAIVSAVEFKGRRYHEVLGSVCPELLTSSPGEMQAKRLPELRTVIMMGEALPGTLSLREVEEAGGCPALEERRKKLHDSLDMDEPVNIQYTSGTTGRPKGATLTHHGVVNNALLVGARMGFQWRDLRIALPVPLYHCFGCVGGIMVAVAYAGCLVLPSVGYDSRATLRAVGTEKCTVIYGTPTMYVDMLQQPDFSSYDLTSLTTGIMAGSPCPPELVKNVINAMNLPEFTIAYGATESSPVTFIGYPRDDLYHKTHTVGCVGPHIEAKVVDPTSLALLPCGRQGELWVRGHCVMRGYWGDAAGTAKAITEEGWYRTGDLAMLDPLGYCQIVGRLKDLVIRGGENIYPAEVESVLHQMEGIAEAQVVGVSDERMGEELCACIRLKNGSQLTPDDVRAFCQDKVAHFKVPRYVVMVDSFPLTVTGKIQKFKLQEQMELKLSITKK